MVFGYSLDESPLEPSPSLVGAQRSDSQGRTQSHGAANTAQILQLSEGPGCCAHSNISGYPPGMNVPGYILDLAPQVVWPE